MCRARSANRASTVWRKVAVSTLAYSIFFTEIFSVDPVQAGAAFFAGDAGHPVDQPAEVVLQGRVGDGRGQADGERQGEDIGLADPVAGQFVGVVGIPVAAPGVVIKRAGPAGGRA